MHDKTGLGRFVHVWPKPHTAGRSPTYAEPQEQGTPLSSSLSWELLRDTDQGQCPATCPGHRSFTLLFCVFQVSFNDA